MTLYTVVDWGGVRICCDSIHSVVDWGGVKICCDIIHSSGLGWGEDVS